MRVLGIDPGYAIVGWGVVEYISNRFAPIEGYYAEHYPMPAFCFTPVTSPRLPTATAAARPASLRFCAPTMTAALTAASAPTMAASCGRKAPATAAPATASMTAPSACSTCWVSGTCWTAWTRKSPSNFCHPQIAV